MAKKSASEIKTAMAEQGAREALYELRHLYQESATTYGRIYREHVAGALAKSASLTSLLAELEPSLEPTPAAEVVDDVGTTTPAPPAVPLELHTPEPVELHTRGVS